ncbi:uncharacterized protein LOC142355691, partial [Convolutriloba macropyga]|uniref:uncharacterized protein LOC142355691 n=1 Tax=Convolutriloba macropyga TaxID=536237 RepID=UPI003F52056D
MSCEFQAIGSRQERQQERRSSNAKIIFLLGQSFANVPTLLFQESASLKSTSWTMSNSACNRSGTTAQVEVQLTQITDKCSRLANQVLNFDWSSNQPITFQSETIPIIAQIVDDLVLMLIDDEANLDSLMTKMEQMKCILSFFLGPTLKYGPIKLPGWDMINVKCLLNSGENPKESWNLLEAFLYSWEYLYLTNLELTLGLTKMNPSSKNEASKLTNFLQSACKKVSVASNRASFAILYRQHEMICYHTNNSSKQLLHCDSLTQFLIMLYMLYPSDQMIGSVGRIIAKKKTKKTSEHSRTESAISPPSLS